MLKLTRLNFLRLKCYGLRQRICKTNFMCYNIVLGDKSGVEPPDPIPNSEVKRSSAEDTWVFPRENRSSPSIFYMNYKL